MLRLFRRLSVVGIAGIPVFWWIHTAADPTAADPFFLRAVLAALCAALFVASYLLPEREIVRLGYGLFYLVITWILALLAVNRLSPDYALGLVVVAAGLAGAFQDRRNLLAFQLFTFGGVIVAAWTAGLPALGPPRVDPLILVTYALIMAVLAYLAVSARIDLDEKRRESEERYALAAFGANDGLWDLDLRTGALHLSPRWKAMLGLRPEEPVSDLDAWLDRVHAADAPRVRAELIDGAGGEATHVVSEFRIAHADGSWRWFQARGGVVRDEGGAPNRIAGSQTDITERKRAEQRLVHNALHDGLTGLPNRVLATDRLDRLLTVAQRRPDHRFAVLFLDIDRFKRVNDSLGHAAGDRLLGDLANRLRRHLRAEDTLARFGGDEFVVIAPDLRDEDHALRLADRLRSALSDPFVLSGQEVLVSVSIGVALGPGEYGAPDELLRDADIAMYRAKRRRADHAQLFDQAMHRHAVQSLRLETELARALDDDQLRLHYQPIVRLATLQIDGLEALVRWQHPERGLLNPSEFLPIAEESGLILDLGRWALREAARAQARLRTATAHGGVPIHVNLSAAHFAAGTVLSDVERACSGDGSDSALGVEITESVLLNDPVAAARALASLRERGVSISIDDFGTGYSSLRYLHSLPADVLKIDRSFVSGGKGSGLELVRTVVLLADRLDLRTVAEGIETEDVAARMGEAGASHGQGFLYSRPVAEDEAIRLFGRGLPRG